MKKIYLFALLCFVQRGFSQDLSNLKDQKPIAISGGINLNMSTYNSLSGGQTRLDPFSWTLSASPTLSLYGVQLPFFFLLNKQSRSLSGPFQQFGVSPTYKWAKAHLGYRNIMFSPYTLGGRLFNGVGLELNPGKLRFALVYGQFQKAELGYLSGTTPTNPTIPNGLTPAYQRTGYAMKLGFGTTQNHVDISLLKIKDNQGSITFPVDFTKITPDENTVVGFSHQFLLFKHLFWRSDVGVSLYTRDVRREMLDEEDLAKFASIKNLVDIRKGTSLGWAGETTLGLQFNTFTIQGQYKLISSDYQSMGAYFFNTDMEEYTGSATLAALKGKIQLSGTYGIQKDNVSKLKEYTTTRNIGAANLNVQFSKTLGLSVNYSNYGTTQNIPSQIIDTVKIAQLNQSLMIAPRWFKLSGKISHAVNGVVSYQNSNDLNTISKVRTDFNNLFGSLTYSYGIPSRKISFTPGLIYIRNLLPIYNTSSLGASFAAQRGSKTNNFTTSLSVNYTQNAQNQVNTGSTFNTRLNGTYRLTKKQQLTLSVSSIVNTDKKTERRNFSELYMNAGYGISF
jgi:hypothetical protein